MENSEQNTIVSITGAHGTILDILSDGSVVAHQQDRITEAAQIFFRELERMSKTKLSELAHVVQVIRTSETAVSIELDSIEACDDFFNKVTVSETNG